MACPKSRFYETFYMTPYQKVLKIKFIKIGQKILFGLILLELQIFFFIHTTQDYLCGCTPSVVTVTLSSMFVQSQVILPEIN